jgi:hypothetical protein
MKKAALQQITLGYGTQPNPIFKIRYEVGYFVCYTNSLALQVTVSPLNEFAMFRSREEGFGGQIPFIVAVGMLKDTFT